MLETAYVLTWRWSDGSGSGATAVFMDKKRAERLIEVLTAESAARDYKIEAAPFDSTAPSGVMASYDFPNKHAPAGSPATPTSTTGVKGLDE